jgi:predicted RNase H-like HicB family nuclease
MNAKISIQVEKTETGYSAYSPEIAGSQVQGESVESLVDALKPILSHYLNTRQRQTQIKTNQPIWKIAQEITSDMTDEEIRQLPADGSEQHDHYIYGIPKRTS